VKETLRLCDPTADSARWLAYSLAAV